MIKTVGSICSGIEAASKSWESFDLKFEWLSEIAQFPSDVLSDRYPNLKNLGDINDIPKMIAEREIVAPDLICGGTPCQAFSFAGWKKGLEDDRGNLTLKFVDIINENDNIRESLSQKSTVFFWENVEGVLSDKTNAFGCMISSLAGMSEPIVRDKWPKAGVLKGPKRNIAWRVMDAKFFGISQQRKRLYLLGGGKDFNPEAILFEKTKSYFEVPQSESYSLSFYKEGQYFEVFREYTDCLYAAYGTKWNGNAAATNGSLFVIQGDNLRRLSNLECERLMGFPDNYTNISSKSNTRTTRYQAVGNSWAVPVIKWIGERLFSESENWSVDEYKDYLSKLCFNHEGYDYYLIDNNCIQVNDTFINCTFSPLDFKFGNLKDVITSKDVPNQIYISPAGCAGILRRAKSRNIKINKRLEHILEHIANNEEFIQLDIKNENLLNQSDEVEVVQLTFDFE